MRFATFYKYFLVLLVATLSSCASTVLSTYKAPTVKSEPYKKIAFYTPADLDTQIYVSNLVKSKFSKNSKTMAVSTLEFFMPSKNYTDKQVVTTLKKNGVDACFTATLQGVSVDQSSIVLPTFNTATATTQGYLGNQPVSLQTTYMAVGSTVVPYTVETWAYQMELYDIDKKGVVWVASGRVSGSDYKSMVNSLVSKTMLAMKRDGIISFTSK